jgi:hypothetical protein
MAPQRCATSTFLLRWTLALLLVLVAAGATERARGEGSRDLSPLNDTGRRANLEWRNSFYGDLIPRRTIFSVFARQNEVLLLGSSAVGVSGLPNAGDIRVYEEGRITGPIAQEVIPALPDFSCVAQRGLPGNADRGRIASRDEELNGPNTLDNQRPDGYEPCFYVAPRDGIYNVIFFGPSGDNQNSETAPAGLVIPPASQFGPAQDTSITAWDVTVRASPTSTADIPGRVFSYYAALFTGGNGRPVSGTAYAATGDGFIYRIDYDFDPNGFLVYANRAGFLNSDGTPLYHNVVAVPSPSKQRQDQLVELQGGVSLAPPELPLFFSQPDPLALAALGIPPLPTPPSLGGFDFLGILGANLTLFDQGGTFTFASSPGFYEIVISRDGVNFDPDLPQNRVLRGSADASGTTGAAWDGRDNAEQPFPVGGPYLARMRVQGGEIHFPFLDVENNRNGGPTLELTNPPGGVCPPLIGGCQGAFYDDQGYETASNVLVGEAINGPLCLGDVGNPPPISASDPLLGFDSGSDQRRFGFPSDGNPDLVCDVLGGFGDKKGLDIWTFYPSQVLTAPLQIVQPTAIGLASLGASLEAGRPTLHWTTTFERDTVGFEIYRSRDGERARAVRLTDALIPARGQPYAGASYIWSDPAAQPGGAYYWLREVEDSGASHEYGPVTLQPQPAQTRRSLFFPAFFAAGAGAGD